MDNDYSRKADIWSLGCTLLELATADIPWAEKGLDSNKIMMYIGQTQETPQVPQNLPPITRELISSCFHRDPEQRYDTQQLLNII